MERKMIWTDTKNMNGTVGWLKLTGEDDPVPAP
jgi:hypothetical protein